MFAIIFNDLVIKHEKLSRGFKSIQIVFEIFAQLSNNLKCDSH